jgi:hypothetical protein
MSKTSIPSLAKEFLRTYDAAAKDQVWKQHQEAFRSFWSNRILATSSAPLLEAECDEIIRILDTSAKGHTKSMEAVARVMVPQGAWRRMFSEFRANRKLATLITRIFETDDCDQKAVLIDELYAMNEGQKNNLTGPSGNTINAFLVAYDPFHNLSVVSLKDRLALIEFLELPWSFDSESAPIGTRIVESNTILYNGLQAAGVQGSARTVSRFCYSEPVKPLWKPEHTVKRIDKSVSVSVPSDTDEEELEAADKDELRESLEVQADLAEIGCRMGLKIWLPKSDRARILRKWKPKEGVLLSELPLNYDDTTLRTIEQIDVLWLKKRSILRAFEVEHTTSVYSGLLRMADLIALQPNMNISLHIVAPVAKREKVLRELKRPVFSLLEGRALSEMCSYLSYDNVQDLLETKHLEHLSDGVIEEYAEKAE